MNMLPLKYEEPETEWLLINLENLNPNPFPEAANSNARDQTFTLLDLTNYTDPEKPPRQVAQNKL